VKRLAAPGAFLLLLAATPAWGAQDPKPPQEVTREDVLRRIIRAAFQARRYDQALSGSVELQQTGTALTLEDQLLWAKALELSGKPEAALERLRPLAASNATSVPLQQELAQLSVQTKRFYGAAIAYRQLADLQPAVRDWQVGRARALLWARDLEAASAQLARILTEHPEWRDADLDRFAADLHFEKKEYGAAEALLAKQLAADPENAELERRWIEALSLSGQDERAQARFHRLRSRRPRDATLLELGGDLAMGRRRPADAVAYYRAAIEAGAAGWELRRRLARAYRDDGRVEEAVQAYDELLLERPDDWELWREKARFWGWKGSPDASLAEYDAILERFPELFELRLERNAKEALYLRAYDRALIEYEELLRADPENDQALYDVAEISRQETLWEEARRAYRAIQEADPANEEVRKDLALLERHRSAIGIRSLASITSQKSEERLTDLRRVSVGLEAEKWLEDRIQLRGAVHRDEYGFDRGPDNTAHRFVGGVEYRRNPVWWAAVGAGYRQYEDELKGQVLLDARVTFRAAEALEVAVFLQRDEYTQNHDTLEEELYLRREGLWLSYRPAPLLSFEAEGWLGSLTDGNSAWSFDLRGRYVFLEGTGRLEAVARVHRDGFRETSTLYFTPGSFGQEAVGIVWRLDFGTRGYRQSWLELGAELVIDSEGESNSLVRGALRHPLADGMEAGIDFQAQEGDVYREARGRFYVALLF
jgi:predicted Zn-dependent protease